MGSVGKHHLPWTNVGTSVASNHMLILHHFFLQKMQLCCTPLGYTTKYSSDWNIRRLLKNEAERKLSMAPCQLQLSNYQYWKLYSQISCKCNKNCHRKRQEYIVHFCAWTVMGVVTSVSSSTMMINKGRSMTILSKKYLLKWSLNQSLKKLIMTLLMKIVFIS